jgi:hypothetical protein
MRRWRESEREHFFRLALSELGLHRNQIDRIEAERLTSYSHAIA